MERISLPQRRRQQRKWQCVERDIKKKDCTARIITNRNEEVVKESSHNHSAEAAKVKVVELRNKIKTTALETSESPHVIIASTSAQIHDSVAAHMPSMSSLKRTIRNIRHAATEDLMNPVNLKEIVIPSQFRVTEKNHDFLIYDKGAVDDRMLIFGTVENLRLLASAKHWFVDGTIGACSSLFSQLYSIHALVDTKIVPLVFALLPGKSAEVYEEMFSKLKEANPELNPESVMLDMEQAVVKALTTVFPNVLIRFCNFHLNQALYRKVVAFNFKTRYDTDTEFSQKIKLLGALAFLKPCDVVATFNRIAEEVFEAEEMEEFIFSFESEFIIRYDRRRNQREAQFPIKYWNQYDACRSNLPRTNNGVEGWHRGFNEIVRQKHPTLWTLIRCLKIEQSKNELVIAELRNAVSQPPQSKKYRDLNKRITDIVHKYDEPLYEDKIQYLKAIANNLSL